MLLLAGCSATPGAPDAATTDSGASACAPAAPISGVDPDLRTALEVGPARAVVTVSAAKCGPSKAPIDPTSAAPSLAGLKDSIRQAWGPGVHLVRDYDSLPMMLVTIDRPGDLDQLAGTPGVAAVTLERTAQTS